MSLEVRQGVIYLSGRCGADAAEALLEHLGTGMTTVDLTGCETLHAALLQLLMAARPTIVGQPTTFLAQWIVPLLNSSDSQFD